MNFLSEEAKWAYLAASIDGEGTVGVTTHNRADGKKAFEPYIIISNTNKDWIDFFVKTYGGGAIIP